ACDRASRVAERARFIGSRLPGLEVDLARRRRRLSRKVAVAPARLPPATQRRTVVGRPLTEAHPTV
ncbi:MAG: hypothetical protein ACXWW6_02250, partial [Candidatus Limnocylindrales bacterium]